METIISRFLRLLLLSFLLFSQITNDLKAQFGPMKELGAPEVQPTHAKLFDLDGDGDTDILCNADTDQKVIWFENLDAGEFSEYKVVWEVLGGGISIDYADFDQDGDFDVVSAAQSSGEIAWYENDGGGVFTAKHIIQSSGSGEPSCLDAVDFDGDGDEDLFVGLYGEGKIVYFENLNLGLFDESEILFNSFKIRFVEGVQLSDDENLDIVTYGGNSTNPYIKRHMNQGNMQFYSYGMFVSSSERLRSVKTGDVDNDGDIDIYASMFTGNLRWYENLGESIPGDAQFESMAINLVSAPGCEAIEGFDADGDGDLDMVASYFDEEMGRDVTSWYENTGSPYFVPHSYLHENIKGSEFLISGDLTGNGVVDLVMVSNFRDQVSWIENLGEGLFSDTHELTKSQQKPSSISHVDMNDDGKLDLLTTSSRDDKIGYYPNEGNGNYGDVIVLTDFAEEVEYTEATDIDSDGDLDLFCFSFSNTGEYNVFWFENIGELTYTDPNFLFAGDYDSVLMTDYDQDGDMDIVRSNQGSSPSISMIENIGAGQFVEHQSYEDESVAGFRIFHEANFDEDGDIDFFAYQSNPRRLGWFENIGQNQLSQFHVIDSLLDGYTGSSTFRSADLDSDGDLDLVTTIYDNWPNFVIVGYENNGDGSFGIRKTILELTQVVSSFQLIDIQNDDLPDIVATTRTDERIISIKNEGDWIFESPENLATYSANYIGLETGDLDEDGDTDIYGINSQTTTTGHGYFFTIENLHFYPNQARGRTFLDVIQNGILDSLDAGLNFINITTQPQSEYSFSYDDGRYHLFFEDTDGTPYQIQPGELPGWSLTTDPPSYTVIADSDFSSIDSLDFGFYPDSVYTALELNLTGGFPRCNSNVNYWLDVSNFGTSTPSGILRLSLDDSLGYMSSSQIPDSIVGQNIYWSLDSLYYFSNAQFNIHVVMPPFTSMGDTLYSSLTFIESAELPEEAFTDSVQLEQIVICAYDPNDKNVSPAGLDSVGYISQDQELEYLIRFQNTGNDTAITVIIHDQLAEGLDKSTFEPMASSHDMQAYLHEDGQIEFSFFNIMLPDSGADFLGSQGYIKFKVQPIEEILPNTQILNTAEIFFDYNSAIVTNTVQNTIECYMAPEPFISYSYPLLSAGVLGGSSYQWYLNGEAIDGAFNAIYLPEANGQYTVEVADANGCVTLSDVFNFLSLDNTEVNLIQTKVYPNPSSGDLNFDFGNSLKGEFDLLIYDLLGAEIKRINAISGENYVLPKGATGKGMFLAVLQNSQTGAKIFMKKFVIQ